MNNNKPSALDDIRPNIEAEQLARASAVQPAPRLAPEIPEDEPDTLDLIRSAWHRENLVGASLNQFVIRDNSDTAAPDWNPYAYAVKNAEAFGDVMRYVMRGHFDNIHSERDFLAKAEHLRKQQEDKEVLDAGGWRSVAAQMGVGLMDPTNLIPLSKGALKGAVYLGGATAATEGLLHQADPTRTLKESALAIAAGTALGGAFGHWSRHWDTPDQRLHPEHPENPLRTQNLGDSEVIEAKPGERLDQGVRSSNQTAAQASADADLLAASLTAKTPGGSLNAAAVDSASLEAAMKVEAEDTALARGAGVSGAVQRLTERIFDRGTPLSRHWSMPSGTRAIFQRIADLGGRLTTGMTRGRTTTSAEVLAAVERQHLATVLEDIKLSAREANIAVGQGAAETRLKDFSNTFRPLGEGDFNRVGEHWFTQAVLNRQWAKMLDHSAGVRQQVDEHARAVAADLVGRGFTPEQAQAVERHVSKAAKTVEDHFTRYGEKAVKVGLMDAEHFKGAGYGAPVLYQREAINANPDGFRAVLAKQLIRKAPDSFLAAYAEKIGSTLAEVKADRAMHEKALIEWRGEYEQATYQTTLDRIAELGQAYGRHLDELDVVLNGVRTVQREKQARTISALRKQVRASEASYWGRRLGVAVKKAEDAGERARKLREAYPDIDDLADDVQATFAQAGDQVDRIAAFLNQKIGAKVEAKTEAQGLSAALRKDGRGLSAESLAERRTEVYAAISARKQAVAEANEAMDELRRAAAESRNANRWLDAVARRIEQNREDLATQLHQPGLEAMLKGEADRIARMKQLAAEAEATRRHWVREAREVSAGLRLTRAEGRAILRDTREAKRLLSKLDRSKPMHEALDEMVEKIRGGLGAVDHMPNGMLFDTAKDSGRLKERAINWDSDLWGELKDGGFVNTDLYSVLGQHHREMSGRIALQQTLGTTDLTQVLKEIDGEFQGLIRAAREKGDAQALALLVKQREVALADTTAVFNKVRGISRAGGEGDEGIVWVADKLRGGVLVAAAGGFVFSAMTDVAAGMLATSGFFRGLVKHAGSWSKLVEKARAGDPDFAELRTLHASMEHAVSLQSEHWMQADVRAGFGSPSAQGMREKLDKFLPRVTERATTLSGLTGFTNWVRRSAGLTQLTNIARDVRRYDKLGPADRANLTSLGISEDDARLMARMFEKHGREVDGVFTPGLAGWRQDLGDHADYLTDRLSHALVLTQRRASYVPGYGAVPLMMNKWYGALLLQFQSYAFQFTHSFLLAGTQRLATVGETRFIGAMATLLFASVAVSTLRALIRGEDPADKDVSWWAQEVAQRSGLLGYTGPYVDATVKAFGPTANDFLGAQVFEASSKYRDNDTVGSLLGPWYRYAGNPVKAATAIADGDTERAGRVIFNLLPMHQTAQAIGALHDWAAE